ncbi:MAG: Rrf2 family transcriptional regulator [Ignavibacteriae bacterium]|nr:Rrf2 family transcriptional regulator [Ignavibacteriota bacterium]MCB9215752.1 Rrf2 family transcriptional regulator [Ignavibacteria bacterium]
MRVLSNACEYAIRALVYIVASKGDRDYLPVRHIADQLDISSHFLAKIVQLLAAEGILNSYRGPNGGVNLARSPENITLMEVVSAVDGEGLFHDCFIGLPECGEQNPCPLHKWWKQVRKEISGTLSKATLADLNSGAIDRFNLLNH